MAEITDRAAQPAVREAPAAEEGHQRQAATAGYVSIVIPCLNEEDTVAICVQKAVRWLSRNGVNGEVIVVDNGSTDRSAERAHRAGARVIEEPRRGKGRACHRGFQVARGRIIVMGDADGTYDFADIGLLIEPLYAGYDLVIGNRLKGVRQGAMSWSHRKIGNPLISLFVRLFSGTQVSDSLSGFRAFSREAYERMGLKSGAFEIECEMILRAAVQGLHIKEVPIPYYARSGESKLRTVSDGWRIFRFLLLASPNYLFTVPGALLILVGLLTLGLVLPSSNGLEIGPLSWQPVFAGTIFLVVGMNSLLLGFASRLFTTARGITNEDLLLRFYRKYLGLETLVVAGVALLLLGLGLDIYLVTVGPREVSATPSWLHIAAIAQALIISGANLVLVGALAGMLESE